MAAPAPPAGASMAHDLLSDVLRTLRLRSALFYRVACQGRWVALGGGGYDIYRVVPRAWIANRPTRMTTAAGMTNGAKACCTVVKPSTAESTVTAGVIMLSP